MNLSRQNNYLPNPPMDIYDTSKIRITFSGSFLNRLPPAILHGDILNIYIVYEITNDYSPIHYSPVQMSISINMGILDMVLDLIETRLFCLVRKFVKT